MLNPMNRMQMLIATGVACADANLVARAEIISPDRARDLLECMIKNRPVNARAVKDYCRQLREGKWKLNGQAIIISDEGELLDGQHRLLAVIETDISFSTIVIYGISKATFATLDTGRGRSAADIVGIENYSITDLPRSVSRVAGAIRCAAVVENQWTVMSYSANNDAIREALAANGERFRASVVRSSKVDVLHPSHAAALHYVFTQLDPAAADKFMDDLATGSMLSEDDPVWIYRERLRKANEAKGKKHKLAAIDRLAMGVRTWNARRSGQPLIQLKGVTTLDGKRFFPKAA